MQQLWLKRQYWPKHIDGKKVKKHFTEKPVGLVGSTTGTLDEVPVNLFAMKEEDYVMMMMSTYGTVEQMSDKKFWTLKDGTKKF